MCIETLSTVFSTSEKFCQIPPNNKVLLRERKRHTARRVASARYVALSSG